MKIDPNESDAPAPADAGDQGTYFQQSIRLSFPSTVQSRARFLMMLEVYLDESGTHEGSDTAVVAGFLATPEQWLQFELQWRRALADFNIPMFRMSKFANRAGPFTEWQEPERQERLQRLLDIIKRNALASFGVAIPVKKFDTMFTDDAKRFCGGPYGVASTLLFIDVAAEVKKVMKEELAWIAYVMEAGAKGAGQVLKIFQENIGDSEQKDRLRLLSLKFEDKRQFMPLQAADILAYELYKHLPKQPISKEMARYPLKELSLLPHRWGVPDDQTLKTTNLAATYRANNPQWTSDEN